MVQSTSNPNLVLPVMWTFAYHDCFLVVIECVMMHIR